MKTHLLVVVALFASACSPGSSNERAAAEGAPPAQSMAIQVSTKSPQALEAFGRGEVLLNNLRPEEAVKAFDEALSHDPGFALARALRGQATPGPEGLKELESAASTASLSEGERVWLEGMVANRRGELARAKGSYTRLTEIAPGDWRGHYLLGVVLMNQQDYAGATQSLRKATEINPQAGGAQNMLGYSALRQGDTAAAIAAFEEYARVLPAEPNPQDSLGEALLAAGRFKEAEAAFTKAAEISPQFGIAWEGVAYARYFGGNPAGAREALKKAHDAVTRPGDKAQMDSVLAAIAFAQNTPAEARKALDASEKTPGAQPSDVAFVPITRAMLSTDAGNHREALKQTAIALQRADANQYAPGMTRNVRREALRARITAEARLRDKAAAEASAAALEQEASARSDDPVAQSSMHYGRGMLALAQGDVAGARSHFERCNAEDEYCKYQLVLAAEKAGDGAAASAARDQLLKLYRRDPAHIVIRARLMQAAARSS